MCMPYAYVENCNASDGYVCTGATPEQRIPGIVCSDGTIVNVGSEVFCCVAALPSSSGCTVTTGALTGVMAVVDAESTGCVGSEIGFSCTGSAPPLSCRVGSGGSTTYCCTDGSDGG
jgi:hypothetical protein